MSLPRRPSLGHFRTSAREASRTALPRELARLLRPVRSDNPHSDWRGGRRYVQPTLPFRVVCHEHRRSKWRCVTVREMKEGPSGSAIRSLIPSHRELLRSKAVVVSVAETPGHKIRQARSREASASKLLLKRRKRSG